MINLTQRTFTISNRYDVHEVLRQSEPWVVYRAHDRLSRQTVALKRFTRQAAQYNPIDAIDITREFQQLAALHHPNIIAVLDYAVDAQHQPYYTMDYIDNRLDILTAGAGLNTAGKTKLIQQALQALHYLHQRGLVHGQVAAKNLLVNTEYQVKLIELRGGAPVSTARRWFDVDEAGIAADLMALGAIAFTLFTGLAMPSAGQASPSVEDALNATGMAHVAEAVSGLLNPTQRRPAFTALEAMRLFASVTGEPVSPAALVRSTFDTPEFIGREREFGQLRKAFDKTLLNAGACWLVSGESGVGKTRLLDELRLYALSKGAIVVRGQGVAEGGLSYQLWREPARRLLLSANISDADAAILKDIVPDIESILGRAVPDAPPLDSADNQRRLIAVLSRLLLRQTQPVLLLLEDLQWAIESLEPLKVMVPLLAALPVMIVGSYRSGHTLELADDLPDALSLHLEHFDAATTARLSSALLDVIPTDLARQIQEVSGGNALFIIEMARTLIDDALATGADAAIEAQGSVNKHIERRLRALPAEASALLSLAAVQGRTLDLALLAAAAPSARLEPWLTLCDSAALLAFRDGLWAFAHDKIRETALDLLPPATLEALHAQIATAIESVYGQASEYAITLYDHWRNASNRAKEAEYAWRAGMERKRLNSLAEARMLLERALELTPAQTPRQNAALLALGEVCWTLADYDSAEHHLGIAVQQAEATGDGHSAANALFWLSQIDSMRGNYGTAQTTLWRAFSSTAHDDHDTLARIYYGLGDVAWRKDQLAEAIAYVEQSLKLAKLSGDLNRMMYANNRLGSIHYFKGELDTAETYHRQNRALALETGNRERAIAAVGNLGEIARLRGANSEAHDLYSEALAIAREIGHRPYQVLTGSYLALNALAMNRMDEAQPILITALSLAVAQKAPALILAALVGFVRLNQQRGAWAEAAALIGLITRHPAADVNIKNDLAPLAEQLQAEAGPAYAAEFERGASLSLEQVVAALIGA